MSRPDKAELYFEAHVTLDPVLDTERRKDLVSISENFGFKVAKLLMEKGGKESTLDSFTTAHSKSLLDITTRVLGIVKCLQLNNFTVRRYKIEDTVLDSRTTDCLSLLSVK